MFAPQPPGNSIKLRILETNLQNDKCILNEGPINIYTYTPIYIYIYINIYIYMYICIKSPNMSKQLCKIIKISNKNILCILPWKAVQWKKSYPRRPSGPQWYLRNVSICSHIWTNRLRDWKIRGSNYYSHKTKESDPNSKREDKNVSGENEC